MSAHPDSVLLVDDDPMVRMLVKSALVQRGLDVTDAVGGRDALAKFRARRPDIVLLDAMMPDMDGFQTCRELRALPGRLTAAEAATRAAAAAAEEDRALLAELATSMRELVATVSANIEALE